MKSKSVWKRKDNVRVIVTNIRTGVRLVTHGHNSVANAGRTLVRDALNGTVTDLKVKYLAWLNGAGVEFGRKQITSYDVATAYELLTTTYISPSEANSEAIGFLAWYGGAAATASAGTGTEMARYTYAHAKTNLESLQVEHTDIF